MSNFCEKGDEVRSCSQVAARLHISKLRIGFSNIAFAPWDLVSILNIGRDALFVAVNMHCQEQNQNQNQKCFYCGVKEYNTGIKNIYVQLRSI